LAIIAPLPAAVPANGIPYGTTGHLVLRPGSFSCTQYRDTLVTIRYGSLHGTHILLIYNSVTIAFLLR